MKAHEVLRLYEAGRRNFNGENLRGQSFQGENLSGANFSEADIRGTNFTNARMRGAIFRGAKAGLERYWTIALIIGSWLLSGLSGFFSGFAGYLVGLIFDTSNIENVITGWVTLIVLTVFFVIIIRKGFVFAAGASAITGIVAVGGIVAGMIAEAIASAIGVTGVISAVVDGMVDGMVAGAVAGAVAITGAVTGAVTIAVAGARVIALAGAGALALAGIIAGAIAGVGPFAVTVAVVVACVITVLSTHMGWRALVGDEKYAFVREIAIAVAATGGTSFRNADLTDADFTFAILKSTDFRGAMLTRTCWHHAKQIDRVRSRTTYLAVINRSDFYDQTYLNQRNTLSESSKINMTAGSRVGTLSEGNVNNLGVRNLNTLSTKVTNTINQLPNSPEFDKPGLKELLAQLQTALNDPNLPEDDKAQVLEQIKVLAQAGQTPNTETAQKQAKRAMGFLRVIAEGLPSTAKLAQLARDILPAIAYYFGL